MYCCEEFHLRSDKVPRSASAELHSQNIALVFTANRTASKTRDCGRLSLALGTKDSAVDTVVNIVI